MNKWPIWLTIIALVDSFAAGSGFAQPTVTRLELLDGDDILTEGERDTYFNVARCACDTSLTVRVTLSGQALAEGRFELLYGRSCVDSDGELDDECTSIFSADVDDISGTIEESVRVSDLAGGCGAKQEGRSIYAVFDDGDDGEWTQLESLAYEVDTEPPPSPLPVAVLAGEALAEVVFDEPNSTSDVDRYQVLCTTTSTGALPVVDADFDTAASVCAIEDDFDGPPPCADSRTTAESVTVLGLDNGLTYVFEVVAIDAADNPSEPVFIGEVVPAPEEDFWERYKNAGGAANGENCFIATAAFGDYDHPTVRILRRFRDRVLLASAAGRATVRLYYRISPPLADWIAQYTAVRYLTQGLLWPFVVVASLVLCLGEYATVGLGLGLVMMLRASRRLS